MNGHGMSTGTPTTDLLVVRHGQSTWNEEHRWQGQADPPLSDYGRRQAAEAATRIGQVDAIVSSPQERAFATASIIAEHLGVGPVIVEDGLRERSVGPWSGLTKAEIEEQWPGWIDGGQRPEGWESDEVVVDRVVPVLERVAADHRGAAVLVVAHGGVIVTIERMLGANEARIPNLHGRVVHVDESRMRAGETLNLLPDEMRTGGRSSRV